VRCKHLVRPLSKNFSRFFADFENVVELKLLIVDQANVGEAALLVEIDPSVYVADCNRKWSGLQSTQIADRINCIYRPSQDHIICN